MNDKNIDPLTSLLLNLNSIVNFNYTLHCLMKLLFLFLFISVVNPIYTFGNSKIDLIKWPSIYPRSDDKSQSVW